MGIRIPLLGLVDCILYRRLPGDYADLEWQPGIEDEGTPFRASPQPLSLDELKLLPEGERKLDLYNLYTYHDIYTGSQYNKTTADEVEIDGVRYKVMAAPKWIKLTGHYSCRVARLQEGTEAEETP